MRSSAAGNPTLGALYRVPAEGMTAFPAESICSYIYGNIIIGR